MIIKPKYVGLVRDGAFYYIVFANKNIDGSTPWISSLIGYTNKKQATHNAKRMAQYFNIEFYEGLLPV